MTSTVGSETGTPAIVPSPSIDRRGARFEFEGRIYRGFRSADADLYRRILSNPAVDELFDAGLVRSWVSPLEIDGFDLVVESERLPDVTYPVEWSTAMLHEAALVIARVGRALATFGLTLADAHPWNVLFDGPRGRWVDLGSVVEARTLRAGWQREFRAHLIVPLVLHKYGLHSMADAVVREQRMRGAKAIWDFLPVRAIFPLRYANLSRWRGNPTAYFDRLGHYLERLPVRPTPTEWSRYVQAPNAIVGSDTDYDAKQRAVDSVLRERAPGRVLDVGANAGWFTELAVHHGHRVIAVDTDDVTASALYLTAATRNLPVQSLRMDVMWPTGSHGLNLAYEPAPKRLRSDVSMWLAVVHHLTRAGFSFDSIAHAVSAFTLDTAIVEFIPREDQHVRNWPVVSQEWYEQEQFIRSMAPYFPSVEVLQSSPVPRTMLVFRRGTAPR